MKIGLFIKNFETGTRVSAKLTELNVPFVFLEKQTKPDSEVKMVIIDLNDHEFGNEFFIHQLTHPQQAIFVIGYLKNVSKENHEKFKTAGCHVILPRSSLTKNLPTLIKQL